MNFTVKLLVNDSYSTLETTFILIIYDNPPKVTNSNIE